MLPVILGVVPAIIVLLVIIIAMQPTDTQITRSAIMIAPPSAVFANVNDFHKWQAWSPWEKMDPNLKRTFEGPQAGKGSIYSWSGNNKVGEGRMTIEESNPSQLLRIKLEFLKPFKATNTAEFTFKPDGNQTLVTWTMYCKRNFMLKAFGLLMSMDKMVGGDFDRGLAAMKTVAESGTLAG